MASELTLRIMQRIVDKELGSQSNPRQSAQRSASLNDVHLSQDEENALKQLINPSKSERGGAQKKMPRSSAKSKTVEAFAALYNKGGKPSTRPSEKPTPVRSQKMNLNDFVQTMKK